MKGFRRTISILLWMLIAIPASYLAAMSAVGLVVGISIAVMPDLQLPVPGLPYLIGMSMVFSAVFSGWVFICGLKGKLPGTIGNWGFGDRGGTPPASKGQ